jgi:hypothetical protein
MLRRTDWFIDVSEMLTASIIVLMFEAVSIFETSVNINQSTRRNIPEDNQPSSYSSP